MTKKIRQAVKDFYKDLQRNFRELPQSQRKELWDTVQTKKGEKLVKDLIANPNRSLAAADALPFKEWLEANESIWDDYNSEAYINGFYTPTKQAYRSVYHILSGQIDEFKPDGPTHFYSAPGEEYEWKFGFLKYLDDGIRYTEFDHDGSQPMIQAWRQFSTLFNNMYERGWIKRGHLMLRYAGPDAGRVGYFVVKEKRWPTEGKGGFGGGGDDPPSPVPPTPQDFKTVPQGPMIAASVLGRKATSD
jgi:hypothetical protein